MPKLPTAQNTEQATLIGRPDVLLRRAMGAEQAGKTDEALRLLRQVLASDPLHMGAMNTLASMLFKHDARDEGLRQYETLVRCYPNYPVGWMNLSTALTQVGDFERALVCVDNAMKLRGHDDKLAFLRADLLYFLGRFAEAVTAYQGEIDVNPHAAVGAGIALIWTGKYDEAFASFDVMINRPDPAPFAIYDKGMLFNLLGDLPSGHRLNEVRWSLPGRSFPEKSSRPVWLGETDLAGKTLYIHPEQGLGDTLQFSRYAALATKAGARVILEAPKPLLRLFSTLKGNPSLIQEGDTIPDHDLQLAAMSLPLAFGTTVESIPAEVPYLNADPLAANLWRDRLRDIQGKKIGLVWAGSARTGLNPPVLAADQRRSIPLAKLAPLAAVSGCAFFSLQLGPPSEQALHPPAGMVLHNFTDELTDFADTAALVENLDLVISVDTSTAHLAGAMGKPVWLLNRFDTCWRWFLDREDSPWYPTMRIFRQPSPGAWDFVIHKVAVALTAFVMH
jgi:tetratricopeptide (TPR) repeat protein